MCPVLNWYLTLDSNFSGKLLVDIAILELKYSGFSSSETQTIMTQRGFPLSTCTSFEINLLYFLLGPTVQGIAHRHTEYVDLLKIDAVKPMPIGEQQAVV
jgi:hypothetical protein